jgi:hypothetical protein
MGNPSLSTRRSVWAVKVVCPSGAGSRTFNRQEWGEIIVCERVRTAQSARRAEVVILNKNK